MTNFFVDIISWLIDASCRYKKLFRVFIISAFGFIVILFFILIFSILYKETDSIKSDIKLDDLDYFYYSAVTYFTVGYGDLVPKREIKSGEILFVIECFISFLTNSLFIGYLTYNFLKAHSSVKLSKYLYIKAREHEPNKFILRFRIADVNNAFINFSYTIQLFDWQTNEYRDTILQHAEIIPEFEYVYNTSFTISNEKEKLTPNDIISAKYFSNLLNNRKDFKEKKIICITVTANSIKTGDTVILRKYFTSNKIKLIEKCESVFEWQNKKPYLTRRKWANLNRYVNMEEEHKNYFLTQLIEISNLK